MDVQFNEPEYGAPARAASKSKQGPLIRFLIGRGWAKDEAGANRVLLGVAVTVIVITGMVWVSQIRFGGDTVVPPEPISATP
jgi:hypothetical protein